MLTTYGQLASKPWGGGVVQSRIRLEGREMEFTAAKD